MTMSGVSRTACWIRRLHSLTRSKLFSLFSGKGPSFGRLFLFGVGFGRGAVGLVWFGFLDLALVSAICFCFCFRFRWHPRIVSVLQASPLCGAAPTFLCRRKEK